MAEPNVEQRFWRFIAARHEVFRRRHILLEHPPWSGDVILNEVAFTNVYRDLDRTTRELILRIPRVELSRDRLFNIIVFRFFCWTPTYDSLGGFTRAPAWDARRARRILHARHKAGEKIFTGAYLVNGAGGGRGPGGKIDTVISRISVVWKDLRDITVRLTLQSEGMEQACKVLMEYPGFGGFNAYEVLIDACYPEIGLLPTDWLDDWAFLGPGALRGLGLLLPSLTGAPEGTVVPQGPGLGLLRGLRDTQKERFRAAGVGLNGPPLTLENLENCLCEFQKYERARVGGRIKRRYDPLDDRTIENTLWDRLPEKYTNSKYWLR